MKTCYLCGGKFSEWGNNPSPLGDPSEECCNHCDNHFVVPARMLQAQGMEPSVAYLRAMARMGRILEEGNRRAKVKLVK